MDDTEETSEESTRTHLSITTDLLPPPDVVGATRSLPVFSPKESLDHYRIERELGRGATGIVYAAYDRTGEREVALKLFRPSPHPGQHTQLEREVRALSAIEHPNVIALYDFGTSTAGIPYLEMELLEGPSLRQWLDVPRSLPELRRVLTAAGRGLLTAHEHGVVHGDFKPENVLLCGERVVVLDFGLAHDGEADESHGGAAGTRAYMPPEVLWRITDSTPRSDQFSFCVTLWEAFYGERPFANRDVQEGPPIPPRRGTCGRIPVPLRRALVRGLALYQGDRFASLKPILDVLETRSRKPMFNW